MPGLLFALIAKMSTGGDTDKITRLMDPEIMQYRRSMEKMLNTENTISNTTLIQLQEGFTTAYIDDTATANLAYKPAFVSNNSEEGKKVISVIEDELMKCELKCIPTNLRLICGWRRKFL